MYSKVVEMVKGEEALAGKSEKEVSVGVSWRKVSHFLRGRHVSVGAATQSYGRHESFLLGV